MEKILTRTEMQDEIVHTFGFEHPMTISFFEACDTHLEEYWDTALRNLYDSMMYIAQITQEREEVDA